MCEFTLTSCSTDMPYRYFVERNISYVPFHFNIDGKDCLDDLGQTMSLEEFYSRIEKGAMPTTSQVNVGEFIEFFEVFLKESKDVLHISLSTGLSGTYNSACLAREELLRKYPERKIKIVDSLGASSGYGLLLDMAADLRDKGENIENTYKILEENKLNVQHWFFSTNLTHYKRGGRIDAKSAIVGNILNICPLLNVDVNGKLIPCEKIHGEKRAIKEMVKKMEKHAKYGRDYSGKCFISHSSSYENALILADLIEENFLNLNSEIKINDIGTVIGSHTGPGTVALFFEGDKRSNKD